MSEPAVARVAEIAAARRRRATGAAGLFRGIALFEDVDADLASAFEHIELAPGEILWRQTTPSDGLYVLLDGDVQVCRRLPGERELELARLGAGEVLGELPLLGGGTRTATVRALGRCSLLFLSRPEFEARTVSRQPGALELRRRIVAVACARLRRRLAAFAGTGSGRGPGRAEPSLPEPAAVAPPALSYVSRLALFEQFSPGLVAEVLGCGRVLAVPRGHVVQDAGTPPQACYVTLNGAVEDLAPGQAARVGFAGPGRPFGYVGLLDGEPAPVSSVARERSLVLAVDRDSFAKLMDAPGVRSRAFAAAIEADLIRSLDVAERARSRLAAGTPA